MSLTSSQILDAIAERHCHKHQKGRYLFLRELRVGTGYIANRSIDGFLMDAYPSSGMFRTAFEVKVSRADFRREIAEPNKRREAMRYSNYFYFIAPAGVLKHEDIPVDCGLMEVEPVDPDHPTERFWKHKYKLETIIPAPHRDVPGPTWTFMAAALRCQMKGRVSEIGAEVAA